MSRRLGGRTAPPEHQKATAPRPDPPPPKRAQMPPRRTGAHHSVAHARPKIDCPLARHRLDRSREQLAAYDGNPQVTIGGDELLEDYGRHSNRFDMRQVFLAEKARLPPDCVRA